MCTARGCIALRKSLLGSLPDRAPPSRMDTAKFSGKCDSALPSDRNCEVDNILSVLYAHAAGPFTYSISRWPALVSAGHSQPTAPRARIRKAAHFNYRLSHIHGQAHGGSQFRVSHGQLRGRRNIDVASGVSMAMAHRACACRWCIPAALGGVPRRWFDCPRKRRASKRQSAPGVAAAGACSCEGTCTSAAAHHENKSAIHLIMIFLFALS